VKLFADRQIAVEESLISYVLTRIERSFAAARKVVQELDAEAMRRKRALTRALAAEILRRAWAVSMFLSASARAVRDRSKPQQNDVTASVVNLKFLSFKPHARGGTSNSNRTRIIRLVASL